MIGYCRFTGVIFVAALILTIMVPLSRAAEQKEDLPSLELPSMEVYGVERIDFVITGDKRELSVGFSFPSRLEDRFRGKGAIKSREFLPKMSVTQELPTRRNKTGRGYSEGGYFSSFAAGLAYANTFEKAALLFNFDNVLSGGHVDNSSYRRDDASLEVLISPSRLSDVLIKVDFYDGSSELWKTSPVIERDVRRFKIGIEPKLHKAADLEAEVFLTLNRLSDDVGDIDIGENTLEASLSFDKFIDRLRFDVDLEYAGDFLDRTGVLDAKDGDNQFFRFQATAGYSSKVGVGVKGGAALFVSDADLGESENKVYPFAQFDYEPTKEFRVYGRYAPEVKRGHFFGAYSLNQFIDPLAAPISSDIKTNGEVGLEVTIGDKLNFNASLGFQEEERFIVWEDTSKVKVRLWTTSQDGTIETKWASARLDLDVTERFRLSSDLLFRDTEFTSGLVGDVPYVPDLELGGSLSVGPYSGFNGTVSARWIDERFTSISPEKALGSYFLLGIEASKTIGSYIAVFVRGENLLDEEYQVWEGYDMPDLAIYGGVRGNW